MTGGTLSSWGGRGVDTLSSDVFAKAARTDLQQLALRVDGCEPVEDAAAARLEAAKRVKGAASRL